MSLKAIREFKSARRMSYRDMALLASEFMGTRGLLTRYAAWLARQTPESIRRVMDAHLDDAAPARRKSAEKPVPLFDLIERRNRGYPDPHEGNAQWMNGVIKKAIKVSPKLQRRLDELKNGDRDLPDDIPDTGF